ncbi:MAG: rod shape-determining protein MreD [Candidatus Coatesbacteria bacterium]|nr:MAG: rod shape-determining protein MreD [Candidatus Coatesbacteria bacterium]
MRIFTRYVLIIAAVVYVDHAVLPRLLPEGVAPDLTLATIIYLALAVGGVAAVAAGFALGLISDLLGWGPVGVGALIGTLAGAVFSYFRGQIYERSLLVPAVFTAVAFILKKAITLGLLAGTGAPVTVGWPVVGRAGVAALVTAAAAFPLLFLYWRLLPPRRP